MPDYDHPLSRGPIFSDNGSWFNDFVHYEFADRTHPDVGKFKDWAQRAHKDVDHASFERLEYWYDEWLRNRTR